MKLFSEILKTLAAEGLSFSRVQYTVVDGKGGYFQNVKKLLEFSETQIVFAGGKGSVRVEGCGLKLGKYYAGDVLVYGDIFGVYRVQ